MLLSRLQLWAYYLLVGKTFSAQVTGSEAENIDTPICTVRPTSLGEEQQRKKIVNSYDNSARISVELGESDALLPQYAGKAYRQRTSEAEETLGVSYLLPSLLSGDSTAVLLCLLFPKRTNNSRQFLAGRV